MVKEGKTNAANLPTHTYYWPLKKYLELYNWSVKDPEGFWADQASILDWDKPWEKVLDWNLPYARWFVGGRLNASVQCVDRHMKTWRRNKVAIFWEGENGDTRTLSYSDLFREVNRFASVLKKLGIRKGDRITLYLPMVTELAIFMLACARIGAVHSVIFSGFSAQAIADRINDAKSRLVITSNGGYRRGKIVPLKEMVDDAVRMCPTIEKVVVVKSTGHDITMNDKDVWLSDLLVNADEYVEPESMDASDPLFVLYTSGTTGKPKGVLHGVAGYMLFITKTLQWAFGPNDDSIYWCTADIGWITGHSYVVYAPLALGLTCFIYEGALDYPEIDRWWRIIEKHRITIFYTSPTAIRMCMRYGQSWPAKHDLSSLTVLGSVGEPINPEAWTWFYKNIGHERCPISDTWWQTETGGFMISPAYGIQGWPLKPGSATLPMPGVDATVVDQDGKEVPANTTGFIVIRKPWPGMLLDVYNAPDVYQKTYWSRFPGWYLPGDYAMKDDDGYFWLLGRADEVIKVAGHRISTAELEHILVGNPKIAEAAATSRPDPVKGEAITLFVTPKKEFVASSDLKKDLIKQIRVSLGAFAAPEEVFFVEKLPKTRSGKIMRRLLKNVASQTPIGDTTTLDDETSIQEAQQAYREVMENRKNRKRD